MGEMNTQNYILDNGFKDNFLKTEGRLNRKRFFIRSIAILLLAVLLIIIIAIAATDGMGEISDVGGVLILGVMIGAEVVYYCLNVRRLHDLGHKNTLAVVLLVFAAIQLFDISDFLSGLTGLAGFVCFLYLLLAKGMDGPNEFGPDPLGTTIDNIAQQEAGADIVSNIVDTVQNVNTNSNSHNSLLLNNNSITNGNVNNNNIPIENANNSVGVDENDIHVDADNESVEDSDDDDDDFDIF